MTIKGIDPTCQCQACVERGLRGQIEELGTELEEARELLWILRHGFHIADFDGSDEDLRRIDAFLADGESA